MACTDPCDCPINKFDAVAPPTGDDDNCDTSGNGVFCPGSWWYDTVAGQIYRAIDTMTCTSAVWVPVGGRERLTQFSASLPGTQVIPSDTSTLLATSALAYNLYSGDTWSGATAYQLTVGDSGIYQIQSDFVAENVTKATAYPENGRLFTMSLEVNAVFRGNPCILSPVLSATVRV